MSMGCFIEYDGQIHQFPVNPSEVKLVRESGNVDTEVVSLGQISRIGINRLAECSFESHFPVSRDHSFVSNPGNFRAPTFYINLIERIRRERKPCRFIITKTKINMMASIENFEIEYRWGPTGDVYFRIDFREFRAHRARRVNIDLTGSIPRGTPPPPPPRPTPNPRPAVGSRVIVNGRLHRDSFGTGPGLTEANAERVINIVAPGRSHPYHVALVGGGNRGWVTPEAITRVL